MFLNQIYCALTICFLFSESLCDESSECCEENEDYTWNFIFNEEEYIQGTSNVATYDPEPYWNLQYENITIDFKALSQKDDVPCMNGGREYDTDLNSLRKLIFPYMKSAKTHSEVGNINIHLKSKSLGDSSVLSPGQLRDHYSTASETPLETKPNTHMQKTTKYFRHITIDRQNVKNVVEVTVKRYPGQHNSGRPIIKLRSSSRPLASQTTTTNKTSSKTEPQVTQVILNVRFKHLLDILKSLLLSHETDPKVPNFENLVELIARHAPGNNNTGSPIIKLRSSSRSLSSRPAPINNNNGQSAPQVTLITLNVRFRHLLDILKSSLAPHEEEPVVPLEDISTNRLNQKIYFDLKNLSNQQTASDINRINNISVHLQNIPEIKPHDVTLNLRFKSHLKILKDSLASKSKGSQSRITNRTPVIALRSSSGNRQAKSYIYFDGASNETNPISIKPKNVTLGLSFKDYLKTLQRHRVSNSEIKQNVVNNITYHLIDDVSQEQRKEVTINIRFQELFRDLNNSPKLPPRLLFEHTIADSQVFPSERSEYRPRNGGLRKLSIDIKSSSETQPGILPTTKFNLDQPIEKSSPHLTKSTSLSDSFDFKHPTEMHTDENNSPHLAQNKPFDSIIYLGENHNPSNIGHSDMSPESFMPLDETVTRPNLVNTTQQFGWYKPSDGKTEDTHTNIIQSSAKPMSVPEISNLDNQFYTHPVKALSGNNNDSASRNWNSSPKPVINSHTLIQRLKTNHSQMYLHKTSVSENNTGPVRDENEENYTTTQPLAADGNHHGAKKNTTYSHVAFQPLPKQPSISSLDSQENWQPGITLLEEDNGFPHINRDIPLVSHSITTGDDLPNKTNKPNTSSESYYPVSNWYNMLNGKANDLETSNTSSTNVLLPKAPTMSYKFYRPPERVPAKHNNNLATGSWITVSNSAQINPSTNYPTPGLTSSKATSPKSISHNLSVSTHSTQNVNNTPCSKYPQIPTPPKTPDLGLFDTPTDIPHNFGANRKPTLQKHITSTDNTDNHNNPSNVDYLPIPKLPSLPDGSWSNNNNDFGADIWNTAPNLGSQDPLTNVPIPSLNIDTSSNPIPKYHGMPIDNTKIHDTPSDIDDLPKLPSIPNFDSLNYDYDYDLGPLTNNPIPQNDMDSNSSPFARITW